LHKLTRLRDTCNTHQDTTLRHMSRGRHAGSAQPRTPLHSLPPSVTPSLTSQHSRR
jgi:hypothetical protein